MKVLFQSRKVAFIAGAVFVGVILVGLLLFSDRAVPPTAKDSSMYEILAHGGGINSSSLPGGIKQQGVLLLDTQDQFHQLVESFRKDGNPERELESVNPDFSEHTIIFMTRQVGASDSWRIKEATVTGAKAVIHTDYRKQGSGCTGLPAFSQDYFLIELPRGVTEVREDVQQSVGKACS